jgi:4'-phosphopantetheinyl transferase EntD
MLTGLVPAAARVAEAFGDGTPGWLFPEEEAIVGRAVERRRREFATARHLAREALAKLGVPGQPLLSGPNREPLWPPGIVGSITHCEGYRAAVVARQQEVASLGIDAEPHAPLPDGVLPTVALPTERRRLAELAAARPGLCGDRLLFSAKESVYKAWFPLTGLWLDFTEADIDLRPDPDGGPHGTLHAELLVPGPSVGGRVVQHFEGRWTARHGLLATAVTVPHA